ncbi:PP0621 family protein [Thiohalophilus sp.]|uniref:PP0621 family protein n=1 Tax=Thiohalophilus sp. TaxID=3028392 RepID=UPI002ACE290F|nr:PP0621 family protein [Thiohalophilus sp.]MDZ7662345.1 PP0621 family protein [Thiohalophilus sp.]MDZ7802428.1 PP0621 family protein [Thiohalophilus sp.]
MPGLLRVIVLALLIWLVIRLYQRFKALARARSTNSSKPGRPVENPVENMVRCEQCGTHVPEKEALKRDGHYYCSRAHLPHDS